MRSSEKLIIYFYLKAINSLHKTFDLREEEKKNVKVRFVNEALV